LTDKPHGSLPQKRGRHIILKKHAKKEKWETITLNREASMHTKEFIVSSFISFFLHFLAGNRLGEVAIKNKKIRKSIKNS
jgi:hypothetical protein